jgi:hypothetical protein
MFGKLIRFFTLNYLTLGWWCPPFMPKWRRVRRKMVKPDHWDYIITVAIRSSDRVIKKRALAEARRLILTCIPWYSPRQVKIALKYLRKYNRVYLPCLEDDKRRFYKVARAHVSLDYSSWDCCGGEWLDGSCECIRPELAAIAFPYQPQKTRRN